MVAAALTMTRSIMPIRQMARIKSMVRCRGDDVDDEDVYADVDACVCLAAMDRTGSLVARRVKEMRGGAARCSILELGGGQVVETHRWRPR